MAKVDIAVAQLFNEYIKHINTLSTGSILILVTFLEKLFLHPEGKWLVSVSIIGFLVSIIGGVTTKTIFTFIAYHSTDEDEVGNTQNLVRGLGIWALWLGFLIGISSFAIFGVINLL
jgi:hypothetical protein